MLSRRRVWMDGKFVSMANAKVHLMSHSFSRGSAVFEVISVHHTKRGPAIFRLDDHIKRLVNSAKLSRMKLPLSSKKLKAAVKDTVRANKIDSGMIKLMCYYGGVEFEVIPRKPDVSIAIAAIDPLKDLDAERFKKKVRAPAEVEISEWRKIDPRTMPVECKCAANYMGGMIAKMDAIKHGFNTAVLLDLNGNLAEGATESLFIVKNGILKTPALGNIISGITRKTVLDLARDINIETSEKKIKPRELIEADEAFLTSSIAKLWPISKVGGQKLYAPGEITRLMDKVLEKVCAGKVKSYKKWLTPI